MTATILQLRDYDWARPVDNEPRGPAVVLILPGIRVERLAAEVVAVGRGARRRSLLGDA
jgi:hypothetical protein